MFYRKGFTQLILILIHHCYVTTVQNRHDERFKLVNTVVSHK